MSEIQGKREYKDRLFKWLFGRREDYAKSLVKALFDLSDKEVANLEFAMLEDVLYVGMKNDVGVLVNAWLILLEQQSTWSPYLSIRILEYYLRLTRSLIAKYGQDIIASSHVTVYRPKLIVLFNGRFTQLDEKFVVKYTDMFTDAEENEENSPFDVVWYNINRGFNEELKEKCEALKEYCWIVDTVGDYRKKHYTLKTAIDKTIEEMPDTFIIKEEIMANVAEVKGMLKTEYDQEEFFNTVKDVSRREGREEGRAEGKAEGIMESLTAFSAYLMTSEGLSKEEATDKTRKLLSL